MFTPDNLPNLLKELEDFKSELLKLNPPSMWSHVDKVQSTMQEVYDSLAPSKQKEVLGDLLAKAAQKRKEIEAEVPKFLEQVQKEQQSMVDFVQEASAQAKQAEKDFQEKFKAEQELAASLQTPPPA